MKLLSQKQLEDANDVFLYNGLKGAATGLLASSLFIYALPRYSRYGRSLTIPLKAFFISSAATVGFVVKGEHGLIEYDRAMFSSSLQQYSQESPLLIPTTELSALLKFKNLVSEYRYYLLFGSWVSGMTISGAYLYKKKNLTVAQKLVEARMYAQAITLLSLVAVAGISAGATDTPKKN